MLARLAKNLLAGNQAHRAERVDASAPSAKDIWELAERLDCIHDYLLGRSSNMSGDAEVVTLPVGAEIDEPLRRSA